MNDPLEIAHGHIAQLERSVSNTALLNKRITEALEIAKEFILSSELRKVETWEIKEIMAKITLKIIGD